MNFDVSTVTETLRGLARGARKSMHTSLGILSMARVNRAFNHARNDLRAVGLLADGRYLDRIDCYRTALPSLSGEMGYVFDESVPWIVRLANVRPGVIYLPLDAPVSTRPGDTLVDVVRHELGHSLAWLDRTFIERRWFSDAFGARYGDEWDEPPEYNPAEYVSTYACTRPAEDFCETFMTFLRCHRSLHRFDRRPGVKRKLLAVARAIEVAARDRVPRVRGPR